MKKLKLYPKNRQSSSLETRPKRNLWFLLCLLETIRCTKKHLLPQNLNQALLRKSIQYQTPQMKALTMKTVLGKNLLTAMNDINSPKKTKISTAKLPTTMTNWFRKSQQYRNTTGEMSFLNRKMSLLCLLTLEFDFV